MIPDTSLYNSCRTALSQSAPLSAGQSAGLRSEIDTDPALRGYKQGGNFIAAADLLLLLNDPYTKPNPNPQGTVPLASMSQVEFAGLISKLLVAVAGLPDANPYKTPILGAWALQKDILALLPTISLTSDAVAVMFRTLESAGVLTPAQVAALTTSPDPAWQPTLTLPARASALGLGVVETADIRQVTG